MPLQQAEHKMMDGFVVPLSPLGAGGISVIIPVFNEARTLSEIITRVLAVSGRSKPASKGRFKTSQCLR
jgi:hypothetical protein